MKHLAEIEKKRLLVVNNKFTVCKIYISEYSTIWKLTLFPINHALPIALDWSYPKRKYKTLENAINNFCNDTEKYR